MRRAFSLQQLLTVGLTGPIIALNVWLVSQIFRYFEGLITLMMTSALLAFLLNYVVRLFERIRLTQRLRISRTQAISLVLLLTIALLVILGITLVPIVNKQLVELVNLVPEWLETSRENLKSLDGWLKERNSLIDLNKFSGQINSQIEISLKVLPGQALGFALGTLGGIVNALMVFVLAFYMLLYGDRLWQGLLNLIPSRYGLPFSESLRLNFHSFFISQLLLALFMTGALLPIFIVLQVPFAVLFAILIGISELIPLIGPTLGIGLVVALLILQKLGGMAVQVGIIAIVLQQLRDNVLAPKMMGDFTGLNPIWVFIALLAGLQIGGFLGIIVAVPIAGTIKTTLDLVRGDGKTLDSNDLADEGVEL